MSDVKKTYQEILQLNEQLSKENTKLENDFIDTLTTSEKELYKNSKSEVEKALENGQQVGGILGALVGGVGGSVAGSVGVAGLIGVGTAFSLPLIIPGIIMGTILGSIFGDNNTKKDIKELYEKRTGFYIKYGSIVIEISKKITIKQKELDTLLKS